MNVGKDNKIVIPRGNNVTMNDYEQDIARLCHKINIMKAQQKQLNKRIDYCHILIAILFVVIVFLGCTVCFY